MDEIKKEILESIKVILNQYRKMFSKEDYLKIKRIELEKNQINTWNELKNWELKLLPYFNRIWELEMTNFDEWDETSSFRFIIFCPKVLAENFQKDRMKFISSSFISDKHLGTFNQKKYGLICKIKNNNILAISNKDCNTIKNVQNTSFEKIKEVI